MPLIVDNNTQNASPIDAQVLAELQQINANLQMLFSLLNSILFESETQSLNTLSALEETKTAIVAAMGGSTT